MVRYVVITLSALAGLMIFLEDAWTTAQTGILVRVVP